MPITPKNGVLIPCRFTSKGCPSNKTALAMVFRLEAVGESSAAVVWAPEPAACYTPRRRPRIIPVLITLAVIAVPIVLGRAMWDAYMGAPWTT